MFKLKGNVLFGAVTCLTALGFMQIGYDNGLMGGLVGGKAFNDTFKSPSPVMIGLIVSILEVGAFLGSVLTAIFGERFGRRKSIILGAAVMCLGSILQTTAYTRVHMIIARIIAGIGLGINNSTVPVFQAEYSPKATRGLYVCMQLSTLNFGIFLVYWIDYAFSTHTASYAWRVPAALQLVFLLPMLFLGFIVDETPRWLAAHDRTEEALEVLRRRNHGKHTEEETMAQFNDIMNAVQVETKIGAGSWSHIFKSDNIRSRRRFFIACGIQFMQQAGGINALVYYAGTLFEKSIGFSAHFSSLMSGILNTWFFVASFIPWLLIDRIGRRPLLLSMIFVMASVMIVQSALIYQVQNSTSIARSAGIGAAAMLFVFQGAFTIGFQATVWVYPSEILPLRLRQKGSAISTATNWIINYVVVQVTPPGINNIGWKFYIVFAVLNTLWLPIIYLFFPETKGLALEDVDRLFAKGEMATTALQGSKVSVDEEEHIGAPTPKV